MAARRAMASVTVGRAEGRLERTCPSCVRPGRGTTSDLLRALLGDQCGAHTFPYLEVRNTSAQIEHEASTSKIGEDQIFYCRQRGIATEDAVNMIVSGFCKEVFRELPMEFAVEAQKLLSVSLEGSVG